jgi:hypothetical protein
MDRLNLVANTVRVRLEGFADWLCGCSHPRTTFPITLRAEGEPDTEAETYMVCLECGRHLAYDWTRMCLAKREPGGDTTRPPQPRPRITAVTAPCHEA